MINNIFINGISFSLQKENLIDSDSFCNEYLKLYTDCFGQRSYITQKWFNWYNLESPNGKSNIFTIRNTANNEIAAAYTLSPFILNFNSTLVQGFLCCNVMTCPSYAGMGLFTQIGQYALQNSVFTNELVLGIPNESAIKGHLKVGWQVMPNLFYIEKLKSDFSKTESSAIVTENINELEKYDFNLFNRFSEFNLQKNYPFLQWRYANNPKNKYQFVISKTNNTVNGYAVIKTYFDETTKQSKIHIVEFSFHELDQMKNIIAAIDNYAIEANADLINTWSFCQATSPVYKLFVDAYYKKSDQSNHCIVYTKNVLSKENNNWQIMLGDNDVF